MKKRTWLAKGYGSFQSAWRTLEGIETMNMIRKGRARWVAKDDVSAQALRSEAVRYRCLDFSPSSSISLSISAHSNFATESSEMV